MKTIIKDLEEVDKTLTQLKSDFNNQMNAIDNDLKEFHRQLIALSVKYPEHKEMLEFIVFINDRIETSQTNMKDVLVESLNQMMFVKKEIVKNNLKFAHYSITKKTKETITDKIKDMTFDLDSTGVELLISAVILFLIIIIFMFFPTQLSDLLGWISSIFKGEK